MLENIFPRAELAALALEKCRSSKYCSVPVRHLEAELAAGWALVRKGKHKARLCKPKAHDVLLEDRVWTLLYRLGFLHMSGRGGAKLALDPKDQQSPVRQLDVVAFDDDVAVAVECKSAQSFAKRTIEEGLGKHSLARHRFITSVNKDFPGPNKRVGVLVLFAGNMPITAADRKRADAAHVVLLDEEDLKYYEAVADQLGPAGRYQFLADLLPNKEVPGLAMRLPAIRSRMAGHNCYSFAVSPDRLLRFAYVANLARGNKSSFENYQRLVSKQRLAKIRHYIASGGIFPTNVVLSISSPKAVRFEPVEKMASRDQAQFGWLELVPSYRSAWVIDGQHRLFAYAGHDLSSKSMVQVLAFENLPPDMQMKLFADINAYQKSVKLGHLQQLYRVLHAGATDPELRLRSIISTAIQAIDADPASPFYGRIRKEGDAKTEIRCITIPSIFGPLESKAFYLSKPKPRLVVQNGPLWSSDDESTINRTIAVLNTWFGGIAEGAAAWWACGCGPGGGVAMGDAVTACVATLRTVLSHLESAQRPLVGLKDPELCSAIKPYAQQVGAFLGSLSVEQREAFRALRGVQGQTARMRQCWRAINAFDSTFAPAELMEWLAAEREGRQQMADALVTRIERNLQYLVVSRLVQEYGREDKRWWREGVPEAVRVPVMTRLEEDNGARGGEECYFYLIDYRAIIQYRWLLFDKLLSHGRGRSKKDLTVWVAHTNEIRRNALAHASSGLYVKEDDLRELAEYDDWLAAQRQAFDAEGSE